MAAGLLLGACRTVGYYAHVAHGQASLVTSQREVAKVVADPKTDPHVVARLELSQRARRFASDALGLPDNRSYTSYVELHRSFVVWNVFAAPRFSVDPISYCFLVAGCVAYRGYFDESKARAEAKRLEAQGDDVSVGGVSAYSTLGWFSDPILSSMLRWDDDELAGTIFHELAHQLIYVKGDSAFNESFASFVQEEGLRQWRASRGLPMVEPDAQAMSDGFTRLVLDLRDRLRKAYSAGGDAEHLQASKDREIEQFRERYRDWQSGQWPNDHRYDGWVKAPINNARLVPFGLYDGWKPAFARLFEQSGKQWHAFYDRVRHLASLPVDQRLTELKALMP
ncbi:aminopeptidase [Dyella terrae]|uniref:Aminopeptidase n=3 Tax=Rhodanobacteraceae TaxID=1775411 RepID=A0A4R0Z606_9GAMM|nr:aminopeptidase [Dyella terrae]TCI13890.1 aminopeptidase [Dyella soli]